MFLQKGSKIRIVTLAYPYVSSAEGMFVRNEIRWFLGLGFDVEVVPMSVGGEKEAILCAVDERLALLYSDRPRSVRNLFKACLQALMSPDFYYSVIKFDYQAIIRQVRYHSDVVRYYETFRCIDWKLERQNLLYCFWTTAFTEAAVRYFGSDSNIISRAHGIDLFAERGYVFNREFLLQRVRLFIVPSMFALHYCRSAFPKYIGKTVFVPIGIDVPDDLNSAPNNKYVLVSCSTVDKNKRVLDIAKVIIQLSKNHTNHMFEWYHFGDGPQFKDLLNLTENECPENLHCQFEGNVNRQTILHFYTVIPVSLFLSFSNSEGGRPLSIQEAMSYGIPICVTPNGGIRDIFSSRFGIAVEDPIDFSKSAALIYRFLTEKSNSAELRNSIKDFAASEFSVNRQCSELSKLFKIR